MRRAAARWAPALLAVALAVVVRWPSSVFADAIPRDHNTALHMVMAGDLARTLDPLHLSALDFPDAVPVRLIGWPLLLLAAPLARLVSPVVAFNLAVTAWVALQGLAVDALGRAWGWRLGGRAAAVVAAVAAPVGLVAMGNGQYENVVVAPLCLVAWGSGRGGRGGLLAVAGGLMLAAFASPYQAVVAGLLALGMAAPRGLKSFGITLLVAILAAVPVGGYYASQAADGPAAQLALTRTRPAPATAVTGTPVVDLILPRAQVTTMQARVASPGDRIAAAARAPSWEEPAGRWPLVDSVVATWLGGVLLVAGLLGLWKGRADPRVRGVALGAAAALLLALGPTLRLTQGLDTGLPLPWAAARWLGPLAAMAAPWRFVTGPAFALVVGLGAGLSRTAPALGVGALVLLEALLIGPGAWPVPASAPRVAPVVAVLPDGPVAVWPGTPGVATVRHALLSLALERPVASWNGPPDAGGMVEGYRPTLPDTNMLGETDAAWLARVRAAGVVGMVELVHMPDGLRQRLLTEPDGETDGLRVYRMAPTP
jgi:hypothetical protein